MTASIRLLAGPHDGRTVARPAEDTHCTYHDGMVYEYRQLPDDPSVYALSRWDLCSDWDAVEVELQRILRKA